jgi:hypothetical protein
MISSAREPVMLRRLVLGLLASGLITLAFSAAPVRAEDKENPYVKTREQMKKESEDAERQYERTLRATRGATPAPVNNDPWANMRSSGNNAAKSK